jgi:hypothetical protein
MNRKPLSRFAFIGTAIILAVTISTSTASSSSSKGSQRAARPGSTVVQNSVFSDLNDSIAGITNSRIVLTGNSSFHTDSSGKSVDLRGTGSMVSDGNYWDMPPAALFPIILN